MGSSDPPDGDDQRAGPQDGRRLADPIAVLGLFLDLEVRLLDGPVFVGQPYAVESEIVGLGESRRTESYWTRTTLTDVDRGTPVAGCCCTRASSRSRIPATPPNVLR